MRKRLTRNAYLITHSSKKRNMISFNNCSRRAVLTAFFTLFGFSLMAVPLGAGTFKRTKNMDVYYAFGVSDWADFDMYESYGWIPYAEVEMYPNGQLDAFDTQSGQSGTGTYNKVGRYLDLDLGPTIMYTGERVSNGPKVYEGVIILHGQPCGLWRGYFR